MRKSSKVAVSDIATLDRPVARTAIEAAYTPVDDTMSGGYCLDSGLNGPVGTSKYGIQSNAWRAAVWKGHFDTVTSHCIYNPSYDPATPHKIVDLTPVEEEVPDVLTPYYGKDVAVVVFLGMDAGKEVEFAYGITKGEDARNVAIRLAKSQSKAVRLKCADTGTLIDVVFFGKSARTATRTAASGSKAKVLTAEEIEAKRIREEEEERERQRKAAEKERKAAQKAKDDLVKDMAKMLAAKERQAQIDLFTREQGATPKEQNYAWNTRNPDKVAEKGPANFGWNQKGQEYAEATGGTLVTALRLCEASLSEGVERLGPAFRIIPAGDPIPAGWTRVPVKRK